MEKKRIFYVLVSFGKDKLFPDGFKVTSLRIIYQTDFLHTLGIDHHDILIIDIDRHLPVKGQRHGVVRGEYFNLNGGRIWDDKRAMNK
jgi:hypothetical protein